MDELTFEDWMVRVDLAVQAIAFVSVHDLEDYMFRDAFNNGMSPQETAEEVLANDSLYSSMFA